jgi:tetratricopeptide (TPR) repeat protein
MTVEPDSQDAEPRGPDDAEFRDADSIVRADPLYAEGLSHLQAAEWQEAIHCFEELASRHGDSLLAARALEEARFKARLDSTAHVRPVRWAFRWRPLMVRGAMLLLVAIVAVLGIRLVNSQLGPRIAEARAAQQIAKGMEDGQASLDAGKYDEAEASFQAVLARDPGNADAKAKLEEVQAKRQLQALCDEAEDLYKRGELAKALEKFTDLSVKAPGFCNASKRISEIKDRLEVDRLFDEGEKLFAAGQYADAVVAYKQVQQLDNNYRPDVIGDRLFTSYMALGRALVGQDPPVPERMSQALAYFTEGLALRPRDAEAATEQRLAGLFISGQQAYQAGQWDDAIAQLGAVYETRPGYMAATLVEPLYDAYIHSGDQMRDAQDFYGAYEKYRKASVLPAQDVTLAQGRMESVRPFLTPTPTPTNTPTITPLPTATPYIPPTPKPSATPPAPLATYRNQVVFFSAKEDQPGLWVMNPDGTNQRYLGNDPALLKQYDALVEKDRYSPDGRYRLFVKKGEADKSPQIYVQATEKNQFGALPEKQLTFLTAVTYDPVWAPDGHRIAFVSQDHGSDDIWVMDPDGTNLWNYTDNKWEWDKHPTWSPDSSKIMFWSNREGTKQIFVIDENGRNLKKISKTTWDEYDPLWIK